MSPNPQPRCLVRELSLDVWLLDFDPASSGGLGGASVALDHSTGMASISGVHRNSNLPRRSTGELVADGLRQTTMPRPAILEAYNVELGTRYNLMSGGDGSGTLLGNLLEDSADTLGATIIRWEPVAAGKVWHLRVHLLYP